MSILNFLWNNLDKIISYSSGFYGVFMWFYYNKLKFYLFINKFFSSRREVSFELNTIFDNSSINFRNIERRLKHEGYSYSKETNLKNSKIYNINGFLLSLRESDTEDNDLKNISIRLIRITVTYKKALKVIADYKKIIEIIFKELEIDDGKAKFSIKLYYEKYNPFMGRHLANFKTESIKNFICEVDFKSIVSNNDPTIDDKNIFIHKKSISYTTNNLSNLIDVVKVCFNTYR